MAKQNSLFLPVGYNNNAVSFTSADTTTLKTVFTASANDSDVKALLAASTDSAAINLQIYISRGGTDYQIGCVNIPANSGTNGVANAVDLLNGTNIPGLLVDSAGKLYLALKTGDTLRVACLATMTAAKTLWVTAIGQDY